MDEYYEYLAVHVLNEKEIVTYRTLSRALKVHVNLAKQMLWDFHTRQNSKRPGTVHATYLLSGRRKADSSASTKSTHIKDGDGDIMDSSPPLPGSSMPKQDGSEAGDGPTIRSILLVKERDLEKARSTFVELTGIHVYSLQSEDLGNFQTLTDCTRKIFAMLRTEDALESGKQYGTIQNPNVRRRSRKTPLQPTIIPNSTVNSKPATIPANTKEDVDKHEPKMQSSKIENQEPRTTKPAPKPATLKREGSSIMASFAKTAAKTKATKAIEPKKAEAEAEDTGMAGMSDDEPDDGAQDAEMDIKAPSGRSKQERQAELEAMMDDEDEEMDDVKEPELEPEPEETATVPEPESHRDTVTVEGGRRRGRRKVTKKRTVRDEEGYLVTKEEAVWESFSEDEPAPKKPKTTQAPVSTVKKGAKPGQGNIMSFFGKK